MHRRIPALNWEKVLANRYNHLLVAEVVLLAAFPLLQVIQTRFPITTALLLLAVIPSLRVVLPSKAFRSLMSVGLLAFGLHALGEYGLVPYGNWIYVVVLGLYASFFLITIVVLVRRIASHGTVTTETVKGGIGVYFLIGIFFSLVYFLLFRFDPDAYANVTSPGVDLFYYSFVTLTTLGYGDIAPASGYAKSLAVLEAFVGQIYLAVFIARLVGMHLAERLDVRRDR